MSTIIINNTQSEKKAKLYDAHAVGKRKSSIARVYLVAGSGKIIVNRRDIKDYFPRKTNQFVVEQPLNLVNQKDRYYIMINVKSGSSTGQAGAVRLGISRALCKLNGDLRPELKKAGFLTRDARVVERKKYGLHGARRACQFSKR